MNPRLFPATRLSPGKAESVEEPLADEAVLQVTVNGIPYTTTVRTPGADTFLARGLMFTEGVLREPAAPPSFTEIGDPDTGFTGCIDVTVPESALAKDIHGRRSAMGTASCGFCGLREPEELQLAGDAVVPPPARPLPAARIPGLLEALRDGQRLFRQTGGTHGAMAFNSDTTPLCLHEDIGRHNAVDKVIGELVLTGKLTTAVGLVVSGRISYEIVYKACRAKLPYLLGVSAPSSLAVEMAGRFGICLLAFCREDRATVYSRPDRVQRASDEA